jgi:hypothetical protein
MSQLTRLILVVAALVTFAVSAAWEDYKPSSLSGALASAPWKEACDSCFASMPFLVTVKFDGRIRAATPERQRFVAKWLKSIGSPLPASTFGEEVAVSDDGRVYWLPIQSKLVTPFKSEVKPGSRVSLYVVLAGAVDWMRPNADVILLINEFSAQ